MTELKGIIPAIASTFNPDGAFDYDSYTQLVRTLIDGGCHGIFLFAIAGEYYKLTEAEERRLVSLTVAECRHSGVPSVISVTKHATEVAVRTAQEYEAAGADTLVVLPPFFLKPGGSDIIEHLRQVARAVTIPVVVQYAPEQTGVSIPPQALANLSNEIENLQYFKIECKPPGAYISKIMELTNGAARVIVGNAGFQMIEGFDRGATGVMPGCSMYDVYLKIYQSMLGGQRDAALAVHNDLNAILNHIRQNVEMIIAFEKRILKKRGIIASDACRTPTFASDPVYDALFETYYDMIRPHFAAA
jgi:dihydrodipicolinate synthase/N-acetylneuraminate lyase